MCECCGNKDDQACDCGTDGCSCDCGSGCCDDSGSFQRRYQTKAEKIADLESYLKDLKLEVQAVEENIADLRK